MSSSISETLRIAIARHAHAGRIAVTGPEGAVSYEQLGQMIDRYAAGCRNWGVSRGTRIGFVAAKTVEAVAAYFGAMQAGACVCFIEPQLAAEAIVAQMAAVNMRRLVADAGHLSRFSGAIFPDLDLMPLSELAEDGQICDDGLGPDDEAMMLFTSGSTGKPKGVLLRHGALLCNAEGVLKHTGTSPADRLLHVMPLYHTNGVNNQLIVPFLAGASLILVDRFRAEDAVEMLRSLAPTYMTGVPTMYARMLPHIGEKERFPALRFLRCGSAPITPTLHQQVEEAFGVPLIVSYGLSEATCTSTMNPPAARKVGSIGTVLEGQEVRLFNPSTDIEVPSGTEGEIRIRGPVLMNGYIGADVEQPIVDGWLRTGDLGRFDEDGYVMITGRIKDVIIRGGENISPAVIEKQLVTHPAVKECCVVGAADADLGEVPVAFVVLRQGEQLDEPELKDFVKQSLARIYVPAAFHTIDTLPTNGVGKIDRKALRKILS